MFALADDNAAARRFGKCFLSLLSCLWFSGHAYAQLDPQLIGSWVEERTHQEFVITSDRFIQLNLKGNWGVAPLASLSGRGRITDCITGGGNLCFEKPFLKCAFLYNFNSQDRLLLDYTGGTSECRALVGTYVRL